MTTALSCENKLKPVKIKEIEVQDGGSMALEKPVAEIDPNQLMNTLLKRNNFLKILLKLKTSSTLLNLENSNTNGDKPMYCNSDCKTCKCVPKFETNEHY